MLRNIPNNIPADLLKIIMEMGHGDEICIGDANYPAFAHPDRVVDCSGQNIPELLDSILSLFPLDPYVENPTTFMAVLPNDPFVPTIWDTYREIGKKYEKDGLREVTINKFDFYEQSKKAYAVVKTTEKELYANIILKKGVL